MTDPADEPQASETSRAKAAQTIERARALVTTPQEPQPLVRRPSRAMVGVVAIGAATLGALAVGALAIGALAVGRLAIGNLAIGRTRMGKVEIGDLVVRRLTVLEVAER